MINPSKEQIERLARTNPIVRACLDAHRFTHGISYLQALSAMVIYMSEQNSALHAQLVDAISKMPIRQEVVGGPNG